MKKSSLFILLLFISGCFDNTDDLKAHIAQVQANTPTQIEPMPSVPVFHHVVYSASSLRSPFDAPSPEAIQEKTRQALGCLSPDPTRKKQPLERFSLSDVTMRGTLGERGVIWALVQASDATLHRVSVGHYLGLYNGKITEVSQKNVKVTELIPDGAGCWVERETVIAMVQADVERQGK